MEGISVTDAPCFFNGPPDSVFMLCASLLSIGGDSCTAIGTNDLVGEGDERYCDNASSVFGLLYKCVWTEDHDGVWGSCGSIYYLSNTGLDFFVFLFDCLVDYISKELCHSNLSGCPFSKVMVLFFLFCVYVIVS
jgi:hypothetical protein